MFLISCLVRLIPLYEQHPPYQSPNLFKAIRLQLEADRETKEKWLNAKPPEDARKIPNLRADLVQAKKQEDAIAQVDAPLPPLSPPPFTLIDPLPHPIPLTLTSY